MPRTPDTNPAYREASKSEIKTIFELSEDDKLSVRQAFSRNKGVGRIVVHPFFLQRKLKSFKERSEPAELDRKYRDNLERQRIAGRMMLRDLKNNPEGAPVFLLEEQKHVDDDKTLFTVMATEGKLSKMPIIIPTYDGYGFPLIPGKSERDPYNDENWDDINALLKAFGGKEFWVSGMYLEVAENDHFMPMKDYYHRRRQRAQARGLPSPNLSYSFSGCVENAVSGLAKEFQVEPSYANFPHSRKEILKIEKKGSGNV